MRINVFTPARPVAFSFKEGEEIEWASTDGELLVWLATPENKVEIARFARGNWNYVQRVIVRAADED